MLERPREAFHRPCCESDASVPFEGVSIAIPSSDRPAADGPPPGRRSGRHRRALLWTIAAVGVIGLVTVWTSRDVVDDVENETVPAPSQALSGWERVGSLPDGAEIALIAGDRIVAFGWTGESMDMWILAREGAWIPIDLPIGTREVDVDGAGDMIVVAAVGDDVSLTLIEPVRMTRPWVTVDGDRVVSLRLIEGTVDAVLETADGVVQVTVPAGWASLDTAEWDVAPVVKPYPRRPVFLEHFDHGLIVGTERIDDEALPGRVIVSPDNGATWVEFDLGGVSDFGSVGGVPGVIGADGVVYRVEPGPPVVLVVTDAGDAFERPPWPWAGGLAERADPTGSSYTYLPSLNAEPQIVQWDESGIELLTVNRDGLAIAIDNDTGDQLIYRWQGTPPLR